MVLSFTLRFIIRYAVYVKFNMDYKIDGASNIRSIYRVYHAFIFEEKLDSLFPDDIIARTVTGIYIFIFVCYVYIKYIHNLFLYKFI